MSSKPSVQFNVRLDPKVYKAIEKFGRDHDMTKAQIADEAFRRYVSLDPSRKEPAK